MKKEYISPVVEMYADIVQSLLDDSIHDGGVGNEGDWGDAKRRGYGHYEDEDYPSSGGKRGNSSSGSHWGSLW